MKIRLQYFLIALVAVMVFYACKKEENRVVLESATPPVLTASATGPLVLNKNDESKPVIRFSWTNPNYQFNTGTSSQDVTYTIEVDTTGANFTNPLKQEVSTSKELSRELTVKELNALFTASKMNLVSGIPHNIEFRLKASLSSNGAAPVYSNVIKMVITPYLDVAVPLPPSGDLYITGSAVPSDWTNSPPTTQKFTKLSDTQYEIDVSFVAGKEYKFLSVLGQWQPQYGGSSATGGDLGYNMGLAGQSDPPGIPTPTDPGNYKITVNFLTGKYEVKKI